MRPLNIVSISVYLKLGGVCGLVAVGAIGLFTVFSGEILYNIIDMFIIYYWWTDDIIIFSAGLHCAMQINNKRICLKYRVNIFLAFLCAIIAGRKVRESFKQKNNI